MRAADLLWSGRSISGAEAAAMGMASLCVENPERAALAYFEEHLRPKSASSLRCAVRAARGELAERIAARIATVERLYVDELMSTYDAVEGLEAFIGKRAAQWQHR
jgi:cyclohexa-1,5-dienecarbonyl-CoA hydratase